MVRFYGFQEVADQDPFWIPYTEDELEEHGSVQDSSSQAFMYMRNLRLSKGMYVEEALVADAEKQRTLKR